MNNTHVAMPLWQIQSFGALVVVDSECRRVYAISDNLASLFGLAPFSTPSLACLLGKRLSQRVRRTLQDSQYLPAPLTFVRYVEGRQVRYQLHTTRSANGVLIEIEPLIPSGKQCLLGVVNEWLTHLAEITHQQALLDELVTAVQQLTGYDRVVVCHLDSDWHGFILAESGGQALPSLLGQRFPASDFPVALRRAYERNPIRYIQDVQSPAVNMTFLTSLEVLANQTTEPCSLDTGLVRAPSTSRVRYLQHLGVRGTLTLAIHGDTGLWGILICHSATAHSTPPSVRDATRALVQMATQRLLLLRARQEAQYLQHVQDGLTLTSLAGKAPQSAKQIFNMHAVNWMGLFRADGVALWVKGKLHRAGSTPDAAAIRQWVRRLNQTHEYTGPWCTRQVTKNPLTRSLAMRDCCGAMAMPLPFSPQQRGWLLLFRPEQMNTRYWAMQLTSAASMPLITPLPTSDWHAGVGRSEAWQRVERLAVADLGEDITLAIAAYEISQLNVHLEHERRALANANQRLEQLAHFDPLTQVWNRYRIEQAIEAELVAAQRYGAQFGVLLFDVDNFKAINDTYGHGVGDDVLVELARKVGESLRGCDHLGRWGGEEFIVLARHAELESLMGLAERLRTLVANLSVNGLNSPLTISIGVAIWQPADSCKTLISRADQAMYRAKHAGRNRVEMAQGEGL